MMKARGKQPAYIDLINRFWEADKADPLPPPDAKLYFFLLHECNMRRWQNPFELQTRYIETALNFTRKAIGIARERLRERGLIEYSKGSGSGKSSYTVYVSHGNAKGNTSVSYRNTNRHLCSPTETQPKFVFPTETQKETQAFPTETQIGNTPIIRYKDKDYNIDNDINIITDKEKTATTCNIFDELKSQRMWAESICKKFSVEPSRLPAVIDSFALHCECLGNRPPTLRDAKQYFFNWLAGQRRREDEDARLIKLQQQRYGTENRASNGASLDRATRDGELAELVRTTISRDDKSQGLGTGGTLW